MERELAFAQPGWPVALRGYAWIDDIPVMTQGFSRTDEREVLVPLQDELPAVDFRTAPSRRYQPMSVPALHRRFADVQTSRQGIAAFCTEFGMLGRSSLRLIPSVGAEPTKNPLFVHGPNLFGEGRRAWVYEVSKVRELLRIHDALRSSTVEARLALIGQDCRDAKVEWLKSRWDSEVDPPPAWFTTVVVGEDGQAHVTAYPYNVRFEMAISKGLLESFPRFDASTAESFLRYEIDRELMTGVRARLPSGQRRLVFAPKDLLASIYAHFALEISGQSPPAVRCPACGRWFEQGHGRQRYCEDRCRATAYRRRKGGSAVGL